MNPTNYDPTTSYPNYPETYSQYPESSYPETTYPTTDYTTQQTYNPYPNYTDTTYPTTYPSEPYYDPQYSQTTYPAYDASYYPNAVTQEYPTYPYNYPQETFTTQYTDEVTSTVDAKPNLFVSYHKQFKADQIWINDWLGTKTRRHKSNADCIKIGQAQIALKKSLEILNKLKKSEQALKAEVSSLSTIDWQRKLKEIDKQKSMLVNLLAPFDSPIAIEQLEKDVKNRRHKRHLVKLRKKELKQLRKEKFNRRQQLHESIDRWLEEQKEQVERVKRAECLKRDADCILAEVNRKKADARRLLNLIAALVKLRSVREVAAQGRGEKISLEDSNTFSNITERLIGMWEKALKTYNVEECGLKVMIESRLDEKPPTEIDQKLKNIIKEWDFAIFGPKFVPSSAYWTMTYAQKDMETFIAVRKSWDTFVTAYENGTKIPIGWVLPEAPSSKKWEKFLDKS